MVEEADLGRIIMDLGSGEEDEMEGSEEQEPEIDETDSGVVRLCNQIIIDAYNRGASDIHVEPYGKRAPCVVRLRVDGECEKYIEVPAPHRNAVVQRLKIMSKLDIAEKRKPQDGKIRFRGPMGTIELRVATIPTSGGNEDVVMRILAASKPLPLEKMGFSDRNVREFKEILSKPYGIALVVGPTGSGKTTTLHSALGFINKVETKIWTAEDPGGDHPARAAAGPDPRQDRLHLRRRHALVPARRPRRDHGRRDARPRDRGHRHRGLPHRTPGLLHAAHQLRRRRRSSDSWTWTSTPSTSPTPSSGSWPSA